MTRRLPGLALALAALWVPAAAATAQIDLRQLCDRYTPFTLVGVDTAAGVAVFTMPSRQPEVPSWMVELHSDGQAAVIPDWRRVRRLGGSVAPGPVLVAGRCGEECLQPLVWQEGAWQPLGAPLTAPGTATVHTTRDGNGVPWLVLHSGGSEPGVVEATAWRYESGRWIERGSLPVAAVGNPAARPAAGGGVVTGSGRFLAGGPPVSWVRGLPGLPPAERGQLLPLGGSEVGYLARDGRLYLSADQGATWSESRWLPWAENGAASGEGWTADLPLTDHRAPLAVAWFDNRDPARPELHLVERPVGGPWQVVARLAGGEPMGGELVGYTHLLRWADGRWQLVAGCDPRPDGSGLWLRTVERDGSSRGHSAWLRPAWLDRR